MYPPAAPNNGVEVSYTNQSLNLPIFVQLPTTEDLFPEIKATSSERLVKLFIIQIPSNVQKIEPLFKTWKQQIAESLGIHESRILALTVPLKEGRLLIQNQADLQAWAACSPSLKHVFNSQHSGNLYANSHTKRDSTTIEKTQFELLLRPKPASFESFGSTGFTEPGWGKSASACPLNKNDNSTFASSTFRSTATPAVTSALGRVPFSTTTTAPAAKTSFGNFHSSSTTATTGASRKPTTSSFGSYNQSSTAAVPAPPVSNTDHVSKLGADKTTTSTPATTSTPNTASASFVWNTNAATSTTAKSTANDSLPVTVPSITPASGPKTTPAKSTQQGPAATLSAVKDLPEPALPLQTSPFFSGVVGLVDALTQLRSRVERSSSATSVSSAAQSGASFGSAEILDEFHKAFPAIPSEVQHLFKKLAEAIIVPSIVGTSNSQSGSQEQQQPAPVRTSTAVSNEPTAVSTSGLERTVEKTEVPADTASGDRQATIAGLHEEFTRMREQRAAEAASTSSSTINKATASASNAIPDAAQGDKLVTEAVKEPIQAELTEAFQKLLASPSQSAQSDDEMVIVDPASSTQSNSPRSRSPRSSKGKSTLFTSSLTLLTLFSMIMTFLIAPSSATSLAPRDVVMDQGSLFTRDIAAESSVAPRQNSRNLYLCKCTCFQTNSTLVPIYSPVDASKPCTTCTRQFCLDQNLDICKDAKLEHTDHDVGTGLEGDVWAKCFERDSYKDQSIITLYLLVVVGLVAFSALRGRMQGLYHEYQTLGPSAIYNSVRNAPWRR